MSAYFVICVLVTASVFTGVARVEDIYWVAEGTACQRHNAEDQCIHHSNCLPNKDGNPSKGYPEFCRFSGMTSILCCKEKDKLKNGIEEKNHRKLPSLNYSPEIKDDETASHTNNRVRRGYPGYFLKLNISLGPNDFKQYTYPNFQYWPRQTYPSNVFFFINFNFGTDRSNLPTYNNQPPVSDSTDSPPNQTFEVTPNLSVPRIGLDVNTTASNSDEESSETDKKIKEIFEYDFTPTSMTRLQMELPQDNEFISPRYRVNDDDTQSNRDNNNNSFRRTADKGDVSGNSDTKSFRRCVEFFRQVPLSKENHTPVIGGRNARPKEFSHLALLGYSQSNSIKWLCGGALISENYVITAAHCVRHKGLGQVKYVRLGEFDLISTAKDTNEKDFTIAEIITHPSFNFNAFYHDIALIKLNGSVGVFSNYIRPICLPTTSIMDNSTLVVPAWHLSEVGRPPSNILQRADLNPLDDERCKKFYGPTNRLKDGILQEIQFCAYARDARQDTCHGDIGGPLHYVNNDDANPDIFGFIELVGITAFGGECSKLSVGVYTRVLPYVQWIESIVFP